MEPSYPPLRRELQLQGPRPAPLRVSKSSQKIKKQPPRDPVIIYTISPKVIHVDAADFMGIVQSLTGPSEGEQALSPAAKLATLQRIYSGQPPPSNRLGDVLDQMEMDRPVNKPGILSPAPVSLPPVSPAFFSPSCFDPSFLSFLHDLSPMGLLSGRPSHSQGGAVGASGGDGNFFISPGKFCPRLLSLLPGPLFGISSTNSRNLVEGSGGFVISKKRRRLPPSARRFHHWLRGVASHADDFIY